MAELTAFVTNSGVPLTSPVTAPTIEVRRNDTQAIVQAAIAMTDQGNGLWTFTFVIAVTSVDYTFQVDADPLAAGQVTSRERFLGGSFGGDVDLIDSRIDVAISTRNAVVPLSAAADQAEHDATQVGIAANLAAIAALNDLSIGDVQTALDNQGYTAARALLLDNLDAAITTRATQAQILSDATPFPGANIDAAISSRAAPGDAMTLTGATLTAIQALILSDATPFQGADIAAILTAVAALDSFIQGGREIDFVGDDVLGWQRVERDVGGTIIRRYDLFDESDVRINETVATFIGRQGMISRETISP